MPCSLILFEPSLENKSKKPVEKDESKLDIRGTNLDKRRSKRSKRSKMENNLKKDLMLLVCKIKKKTTSPKAKIAIVADLDIAARTKIKIVINNLTFLLHPFPTTTNKGSEKIAI